MTTYETIIVDGVDLADVVECVTSLDGLYLVGAVRGENVVFPGVDGETWLDRPYATGLIDLGIFLKGNTTAQFNDSFRELKKLVRPGKRLSLERRMSFTTGNETHTAFGEYASGLNMSMQLMRFGRTTLGLKIHDGLWHGPQVSVSSSVGTTSVAGEMRTHRMTLSMPPGATLTNTTTSHSVTNSAPGGGTVLVDVEMMSATQDGDDVSYALTWTQRYPMRLEPGNNTFTVSGGDTTIAYKPAYL